MIVDLPSGSGYRVGFPIDNHQTTKPGPGGAPADKPDTNCQAKAKLGAFAWRTIVHAGTNAAIAIGAIGWCGIPPGLDMLLVGPPFRNSWPISYKGLTSRSLT